MYQSAKHHNTENNMTSSRNSRSLGESFVVNQVPSPGRMFTLVWKEMFERLFPGQMSTTLTIHNVQGRYGRDVRWAVTRNVCPPCGKGPVSGKNSAQFRKLRFARRFLAKMPFRAEISKKSRFARSRAETV